MNIETLAECFTVDQSAPPLPPSDDVYCRTHDIQFHAHPPDFYIPPSLCARTAGSPLPVVLISAPAAVGKTSLARELQRRLVGPERHVVYIPLQNSDIGHNFFSGLLAKLFPSVTMVQLIQSLRAGRLVLLFDGYDEVSLSDSQLAKNTTFCQEVADVLTSGSHDETPSRRPCIVFLFRTVFQHAGVFDPLDQLATQLDVEFFDDSRRRRYLKEYLHLRKAAKDLSSLADDFVDAFEKQMTPAHAQAAAFFGHAVVLSAFGDYLCDNDESNSKALANRIAQSNVNDEFVDAILKTIIDAIMVRETTKFPDKDYATLLPGFVGFSQGVQSAMLSCVASARGASKSLEESLAELIADQCRYVLDAHSSFAALKSEEQAGLRSKYSAELRRRIDHHPFLDRPRRDGGLNFRNSIYQDYFLALSVAQRRVAMSEALASHPQASHFMALFLLSNLKNRDFSLLAPDALYHTIGLLNASASTDDFRVLLNFEDGYWNGRFEGQALSVAPIRWSGDLLMFQVPNHAVVQNVDVSSAPDSGAMLLVCGPTGSRAHESTIRIRSASLGAELVELDACKVDFDGCDVQCAELHLADRLVELNGLSRLAIEPLGRFELIASEYAKKRWGAEITKRSAAPTPDSSSVLDLLDRVLLWFRKHGRANYAVYDKRFQTVVLRKGRDPHIAKFVEILFKNKVLHRNEQLIELDQKALQSYGVYYVQQNALRCSEPALLQPLVDDWIVAQKST